MLEQTCTMEWLGPDDPMAGGEVYRLIAVLFTSEGCFEGQDVRRITHDLCTAGRGDDAVLIYQCYCRTGGEGRYGR